MNHHWNLVLGHCLMGVCYIAGPVFLVLTGVAIKDAVKDNTVLIELGFFGVLFTVIANLISAGVIR